MSLAGNRLSAFCELAARRDGSGHEPTPATLSAQAGMDEIERAVICDEGLDPDDPAVVAALDRVQADLAAFGRSNFGCE
jgi:hypothetical protein